MTPVSCSPFCVNTASFSRVPIGLSTVSNQAPLTPAKAGFVGSSDGVELQAAANSRTAVGASVRVSRMDVSRLLLCVHFTGMDAGQCSQ
jgi:hypothetical protein